MNGVGVGVWEWWKVAWWHDAQHWRRKARAVEHDRSLPQRSRRAARTYLQLLQNCYTSDLQIVLQVPHGENQHPLLVSVRVRLKLARNKNRSLGGQVQVSLHTEAAQLVGRTLGGAEHA